MINVSSEYKGRMKENRDFRTYAEVTFTDGEVLTLDSSQFTVSNNKMMDGADNAEFPLGVAVLKYVQIEILNDEEQYKNYSFSGARIRMYIDFRLVSGTERIEKGTYTVITPETYGETVVITAYDNMYKADRDYTTNLAFPQTAGAVLRDICSTCGILLGSTDFLHDDFIIQEKPSGKFREVIGYIAMIACGNARIDRRNYLQIMSYDFSGWETEGNYHLLDEWKNPRIEYNDAMITGFSAVIKGETSEEDTEIITGTGGYVLSVTNPLMTGQEETVLSWLHERISGVPVRPFSGELVSNPLIEFMDLCKVKDRRGNEYNSFVSDASFVFSGYTSVSNSMPSAERNAVKYGSDAAKIEISARKLVEKEKSDREIAIENLNNTLKESSGMYTTYEEQPDGSSITYLHDKRTLAESEKVIKITSEAIGVSDDGGKTYPYGLYLTGDLIARILYTVGINADYIDTGAITVKDKDGEIIFRVDMDTKSVIISGDSVSIGGKTATAAIGEALEEAGKSRNLNVILDNEYQGIPTDYEGNYETFPAVQTTAQVLYGHADVSGDCAYSVQKSDGVTGNWNNSARTYTVTALTADTGWVDITASYLNLFSVAKRFSLSKIKSGAPGADGVDGGVAYSVECSALIIKQGKDGELSPSYIDFDAYYRESGSARKPYKGRYRIEETADGSTWTTVYQSAADESSVRYSLYTFLTDDDGNVLIDDNTSETAINYAIAATRDIANVRCSVYEAGGFTNLLDRQNITVVIGIDALTHDEIFSLLTDNGAVKGIFKEGNQLYVSASYIRSGTLALGGANNGNGILLIFDANGKQIGRWDKDGISATGGVFSGELVSTFGKIGKLSIDSDGLYYEGQQVISLTDDGIWCMGPSYSVHIANGCVEYKNGGYEEVIVGDAWMEMDADAVRRVTSTSSEVIFDKSGTFYGSIIPKSDERLKDIRHWDDTYDDVLMDLEPIRYTWKDGDENEIHVGVGAQTTQRIFAEHGLGDTRIVIEANNRLNVNYQEFHAMEIASIQRNRQLIKSLQEEIGSLKNMIYGRSDE